MLSVFSFFTTHTAHRDKSRTASTTSQYCIHENSLFTRWDCEQFHGYEKRQKSWTFSFKFRFQKLVTTSGFAEHGNFKFRFLSSHIPNAWFASTSVILQIAVVLSFFLHSRLVHRNNGYMYDTIIESLLLSQYHPGEQSKLHILQQYELQKSAFTICKGNFGGVKGKEFLCVMFMDGSLKFFEYDGISQDCVLPGNRTIPTNFIYVPRTDCFIILAPNWDLECYR